MDTNGYTANVSLYSKGYPSNLSPEFSWWFQLIDFPVSCRYLLGGNMRNTCQVTSKPFLTQMLEHNLNIGAGVKPDSSFCEWPNFAVSLHHATSPSQAPSTPEASWCSVGKSNFQDVTNSNNHTEAYKKQASGISCNLDARTWSMNPFIQLRIVRTSKLCWKSDCDIVVGSSMHDSALSSVFFLFFPSWSLAFSNWDLRLSLHPAKWKVHDRTQAISSPTSAILESLSGWVSVCNWELGKKLTPEAAFIQQDEI